MSALTCPKCHGQMRTYERSGVYVDQCGECRGIFLDRGELEHLIDGERGWAGGTTQAQQAPSRQQDQQSKPQKKRRSFFEELFE